MNKKGFIGVGNNLVFGITGMFILLIFLTTLMGFQEGVQEADSIIEKFDSMQERFHIQFNPEKINESGYDSPLAFSMVKIVYSMVDFVLYSTFEVTKAVIRFAFENQDFVNPRVILFLLLLAICAPIIIPIVKLLIIIFLLVKEHRQNRKEKRELKRIEKNEGR